MTDFAKTHAHADDIDTSHIAAERAGGLAGRHRNLVQRALKDHGPQTAENISRRVGLDTLQVMKRISDLRDAGIVIDSGERGRTRAGRPCAVWALAPERRRS